MEETLLDAVYPVPAITIGVPVMRGGRGERRFRLFGWMAVVLGADAVPLIGMLMIPKTCACVWVVFIWICRHETGM